MLDLLLSTAGLVLLLFLFTEEFQQILHGLKARRALPGLPKYGAYLLAALFGAAGLALILRFFLRLFSLLFAYD